MPRSGTNIVIGILQRLGVYTGEEHEWIAPCDSFPNGSPHDWFFARQVNSNESIDKGDAKFQRYIERVSIHKIFLMVAHGITIPGWQRLLSVGNRWHIRMVIVVRPKREVISSMFKKRFWDTYDARFSLKSARCRYSIVAKRLSRVPRFYAGPILKLKFNEFFDGPEAVVNKLADFAFEGLDIYPTSEQKQCALEWIIPR